MNQNEREIDKEEGREDGVGAGEVIRYRQQAERAEKELSELKELHEKQGQELAELKDEKLNTPSLLRGTGPLQGESVNGVKTQGVKELRAGGSRAMLEGAARRAAQSGSRADIQEYLRARRRYV